MRIGYLIEFVRIHIVPSTELLSEARLMYLWRRALSNIIKLICNF